MVETTSIYSRTTATDAALWALNRFFEKPHMSSLDSVRFPLINRVPASMVLLGSQCCVNAYFEKKWAAQETPYSLEENKVYDQRVLSDYGSSKIMSTGTILFVNMRNHRKRNYLLGYCSGDP
jgi:hypothetical protein